MIPHGYGKTPLFVSKKGKKYNFFKIIMEIVNLAHHVSFHLNGRRTKLPQNVRTFSNPSRFLRIIVTHHSMHVPFQNTRKYFEAELLVF